MKKLLLPLLFLILIPLSVFAKGKSIEPDYYATRAIEELSLGNYESAMERAYYSIREDENNPWGHYLLAYCARYLEKPGIALSEIEKAIPLAKKDKSLQAESVS